MGFGNFFKGAESASTPSAEQIKQEQIQIGDGIQAELEAAASSNQKFNLVNGKASEDYAKIIVGFIKENGSKYTIVPTAVDKEGGNQKHILQADVDLSQIGKELHAYYSRSGNDVYYAKEQLEDFTNSLKSYLENYTIYE